MCTQMLVTDEYTDVVHVCRCVFGHVLVQLGHMTMAGVMHIRNPKWPPAKLQVFEVFVTNIHNYCWNMPNLCQIKCFRM